MLFGGVWPFILRKEGQCFRLIGHYYVHGIMDGEAVVEQEEKGVRPLSFKIR